MTWAIIFLIIVGFIFYFSKKDYKENIDKNINPFGGMRVKYKVLIDFLVFEGGLNISKITNDRVELKTNSAIWDLDYIGHNLEINMKALIPIYGNISKKWIYPDGYPQEKMIEEIKNYFDWLANNIGKSL